VIRLALKGLARLAFVCVLGGCAQVLLEKAYGQVQVAGGKAEVSVLTSEQVRERYAELLAVVPQRVEAFVLYFEAGKTDLAESSKAELRRMLSALAQRAAAEVVVVGHTDRVGSAKTNDEFSLMRAFVVRELLLAAGVPAAVISVAGRGEREPLVPTEDEVAEPRNRRVEIRLR
jgi:OmpA-OmpF porin, OOP family